MDMKDTTWRVSGMHCPRCESAVCRAASGISGVESPSADHRRGTLSARWDGAESTERQLKARIAEAGYELVAQDSMPTKSKRVLQLIVTLAGLAALFAVLSLSPLQSLLSAFPTARAGMSLGALFTVGLLTSLHCVAMCGGINLAQSAGSAQAGRRVSTANLQYNLGRLISYTVIGGIIGALGSVIRLSTAVQSAIQVIAAAMMVLMALNMLDAVKGLVPALPGGLRTRLLMKGRNSSLWVGLVNGLMPCGPLQAMQLYALSTGSWWMGALSMLCFCLGTVPLMLGFGLVSGRLNKRFAKPMRVISGLLVLVMGMAMLTNGLALSGVRLSLPGTGASDTAVAEAGVQVVNSELEWRGYPDITVEAGVPVRWVIHAEPGRITGCNNEMVIPALDLRVPLQEGDNIVEFTADSPGVIPYTCWMGMLRGTITVKE